jgi:dihydroflavonol-4-reductase
MTEVHDFSAAAVRGAYAKTKAEATAAVLAAAQEGLDAVVVHPSGIAGPYDYGRGHLTQMITDCASGALVAGVNGGYDFVDVRAVAQGVLACAQWGKAGECYILSNKYLSVTELLAMLHDVGGLKKIKSIMPIWLAKMTAPFAETYYKLRGTPPLYTSYSLYTLSSNSLFSHAKASAQLGYRTRPFEATVKDTVAWLKMKGRIKCV